MAASGPFRPHRKLPQRATCDFKTLDRACIATSTLLKQFPLLRLFQMQMLRLYNDYVSREQMFSPVCLTRSASVLTKFTQSQSLLLRSLKKIRLIKIYDSDDA